MIDGFSAVDLKQSKAGGLYQNHGETLQQSEPSVDTFK